MNKTKKQNKITHDSVAKETKVNRSYVSKLVKQGVIKRDAKGKIESFEQAVEAIQIIQGKVQERKDERYSETELLLEIKREQLRDKTAAATSKEIANEIKLGKLVDKKTANNIVVDMFTVFSNLIDQLPNDLRQHIAVQSGDAALGNEAKAKLEASIANIKSMMSKKVEVWDNWITKDEQ